MSKKPAILIIIFSALIVITSLLPEVVQSRNSGNYDIYFPLIHTSPAPPPNWWIRDLQIGGIGDLDATHDNGSILALRKATCPPSSCYSTIIVKLDEYGMVVWQKERDLPEVEREFPTAIKETHDGSYIIAGEAGPVVESMGWVAKLDSQGNTIWHKTYDGSNRDTISDIQETSDGGFVFAGTTWSFDAEHADFWVVRLNSEGIILWENTYGIAASNDAAMAIHQTVDGGYVIVGLTTLYSTPGDRSWVVKLNGNGSIAWEKIFDGELEDRFTAVAEIENGNLILVGNDDRFYPDAWIMKLSSEGTVLWQKSFGDGGTNGISDIQVMDDGHFVLAAAGGNSGHLYRLIKMDPVGAIDWQKAYLEGNPAYPALAKNSNNDLIHGYASNILKTDANGNVPYCDTVSDSNVILTDLNIVEQSTNAIVQPSFADVQSLEDVFQTGEQTTSLICPAPASILDRQE